MTNPVVTSNHNYKVFGREEPGSIWQSYMNGYLKGQPIMQFPTSPADIGGSWNFVTNTEASATPPPVTTTPTQPPPTQPTPTTNQPPFSVPSPPGKHHPPTTTDTPVPPTTTCQPFQGCNTGGGPGNAPPAGGAGGAGGNGSG